jgi:hypothetical protein
MRPNGRSETTAQAPWIAQHLVKLMTARAWKPNQAESQSFFSKENIKRTDCKESFPRGWKVLAVNKLLLTCCQFFASFLAEPRKAGAEKLR